jgi:hypothetical protein
MFEKALLANNRRKVLLVHPKATNEIQPLFSHDVQSQIVCLDKHFGRENYVEVNREISEALASLQPTEVML